MSQNSDLQMGELNENKNIDDLSSFFKTIFIKDKNKYAIIDWSNQSNTIYLELKSRRLNHNDYPTTIIGINKINYCKDPTKTYYFAFSFLDGLYFIKYDKDLFKTFQIKKQQIKYRSDVGHIEIKENIHIPIKLLTKIISSSNGKTENLT
jgi:hypothetical protein